MAIDPCGYMSLTRPVERAGLAVDPVLHGRESGDGLVIFGLRKLHADRDVGEQHVDGLGHAERGDVLWG